VNGWHSDLSCELWREAISARLDGEDAPAGAEDLDRHLATCRDCEGFSSDLDRIHRLTRLRPAEAVPDLASGVIAATDLGHNADRGELAVDARARQHPLRRLAILAVSSAAIAALIAGIGLRVNGARPAVAEVSFASAYATVTPDGTMASVYLSLTNTGGSDDLIRASTPLAALAVLHATEDHDGYSLMTHRTDYPVPANTTIAFRPGGAHVMLEGLRADLGSDDTIPLTLEFGRSPPVSLTARVVPTTEILDLVGAVPGGPS
jgi:copper(I)-binding protein